MRSAVLARRWPWEYLTSGAVIRIMAAAFIIAGVAGMIGRRPSVVVIGLPAGGLTASVPMVLGTLVSQNTATALQAPRPPPALRPPRGFQPPR